MNTPSSISARLAFSSAILVIASLVFSGCVSPKYRMRPASADAAPIPTLQLQAESSSVLQASVDSVTVFHGPGSWKQEAYWDEYVVTLANRGDTPIRVESAALSDFQDQQVVAGGDPWVLEKASKTWWENARYGDTGRLLLLGGGAAGAGFLGLGIANAATMVGAPASFAAATTVAAAALPVYAVATIVRNVKTRHQVEAEFQRRRVALPITLAPGQVIEGSLFFRISPSPRQLALRMTEQDGPREVVIELGPLAGLHRQSAPVAPRKDQPTSAEQALRLGYSAAPLYSLQ